MLSLTGDHDLITLFVLLLHRRDLISQIKAGMFSVAGRQIFLKGQPLDRLETLFSPASRVYRLQYHASDPSTRLMEDALAPTSNSVTGGGLLRFSTANASNAIEVLIGVPGVIHPSLGGVNRLRCRHSFGTFPGI